MVLVDVTPLGLGVEEVNQKMVTLVARNSVLPVQAKALFTTVADFQRVAGINVLQGERPQAVDNILLGSFRLENLKHARRGEPDIEICFNIDVEGIVHVSAKDLNTGSHQTIEIDRADGLSEEQRADIVTEARAAELEDIYTARGGEKRDEAI